MKIATYNSNGELISVEDDGGPPHPPLDSAGAIATLLVVIGILEIEDASHAAGASVDHMIHEAQAWSVAG